MSRITPLARALPRQLSRSAHTTPIARAAAAPASSGSSARPVTPRRVAVPASAARTSKPPPRPSAHVRPAPTVAPTTSAAPAATANDFDFDFPLPEAEPIQDYAPSKPAAVSSNPLGGDISPSPPLTGFPNDTYRPLPTTAGGDGVGLGDVTNDWSTSFAGLSQRPFDREVADALLRPLQKDDVEIKPDGLLYLPEIKYRRTLNAAFGPGGWGLAPRGETHVGPRIVSREWGLVCLGRLVSIARGEQEYFDPSGVPTATEACKSNALMRCCKDLGIASELWDPSFIREFKAKHCIEVWVEHSTQKKKRKLWRKKDAAKFDYPYKEVGPV